MLAAAASISTARAVATIAAPAVPAHVLNQLSADHLQRIEADGETRISLAGRAFSLRRQLIEDLCGQSLQIAVERLGRALLVLHSPFDATVGIDSASTLFGWAKHPKSFVPLDDADHLIRKTGDARYAAEIIISWADRYLPASPPATPNGGVTRGIAYGISLTRKLSRMPRTRTSGTQFPLVLVIFGTRWRLNIAKTASLESIGTCRIPYAIALAA